MQDQRTRTGWPARLCCRAGRFLRRLASVHPIASVAGNEHRTLRAEKRPARNAHDAAAPVPAARSDIATRLAGTSPAASPLRLQVCCPSAALGRSPLARARRGIAPPVLTAPATSLQT